MKEEKFHIDLVQLEGIQVISATLDNKEGVKAIDKDSYEIAFHYELIPGISIRSKQIRITADYDIRAAKSGTAEAIVTSKYRIAFLFSIANMEELVKLEHPEIEVDEEMLSSIMNISYSTSRGILYTRYLGTVLDGFILPVIATADLFTSAVKAMPAKKE